jgi:uncharacterized protein (TIGR03086 family)
MEDPVGVFEQAAAFFIDKCAAVPRESWNNSTPCANWTVRQVAMHKLDVLQAMPRMLQGEERVAGQFPAADELGEDAASTLRAAADAAIAALREPGATEKLVKAPMGQMPAAQFALVQAADLTVHSWDIAKGARLDTAIPPNLLAVSSQLFTAMVEGGRQAGAFGPVVDVPAGADDQTKLLALLGRRG